MKPNRFNASTIIATKCECSSLGLCLWIIECIESAQEPEKWIHSKSNESIGDEQGCILLECTKFKAENFDAPRISMWQNPNDQKGYKLPIFLQCQRVCPFENFPFVFKVVQKDFDDSIQYTTSAAYDKFNPYSVQNLISMGPNLQFSW